MRALKTLVPKACEPKQQFYPYELTKCQEFVRLLLLLLWNGILLNAQCTKRRRQALREILSNVSFANRNERISARMKHFANNFFRPFWQNTFKWNYHFRWVSVAIGSNIFTKLDEREYNLIDVNNQIPSHLAFACEVDHLWRHLSSAFTH